MRTSVHIRSVVGTIGVGLLVGGTIGTALVAADALEQGSWTGSVTPTTSVTRIEEDDPRWNCETMGNQICGEPACEDQTWTFAEGRLMPAPRLYPALPECATYFGS